MINPIFRSFCRQPHFWIFPPIYSKNCLAFNFLPSHRFPKIQQDLSLPQTYKYWKLADSSVRHVHLFWTCLSFQAIFLIFCSLPKFCFWPTFPLTSLAIFCQFLTSWLLPAFSEISPSARDSQTNHLLVTFERLCFPLETKLVTIVWFLPAVELHSY